MVQGPRSDSIGAHEGVDEWYQGLSRKPPLEFPEKLKYAKILEGLHKIWGRPGEFLKYELTGDSRQGIPGISFVRVDYSSDRLNAKEYS